MQGAKQQAFYDQSHVTNPETGQVVHKKSLLAHMQRQAEDSKPGAGRTRYVTGTRQPIVAEDKEGTGFTYDKCYQLHTDPNGRPMNCDGELSIDASLQV